MKDDPTTRRIYSALHEDIADGFVWLKQQDLSPRSIVKITFKHNGRSRSVFCEALQFDCNFLNVYNDERSRRARIDSPESSIVLNHWYRAKLGAEAPLETLKEYPLEVVSANSPWGKWRACRHHPQIVVRIAAWLGFWSFVLGVAGLALALYGPSSGISKAFRQVQHPTPTEVFNLRSKCAELGQNLASRVFPNLPRPVLQDRTTQLSHYDLRSNRCYVELDILGEHSRNRHLYDGQTAELLASAEQNWGASEASVGGIAVEWETFARGLGFDLKNGRWKNAEGRWECASDHNPGFVSALIDAAMADDRRQ